MKRSLIALGIVALSSFVSLPAGAQSPAAAPAATAGAPVVATARNAHQQQRIADGLKSGALSTGEAARLERGQSRVNRMEAVAARDGKVTRAEKHRIDAAQDRNSGRIAAAKHNATTGNPQSPSSQRMQADVQRNANQQARIADGVKSGALTTREAGRLEAGQARVTRREAAAGRDGHVGAREQAAVQKAENRQSRRIHRQKHDAQVSPRA